MKEIRAHTTLRAFAALLVFLHHYEAQYVDEAHAAGRALWDPLVPMWRSGGAGVTILFVLAGFLLTRLYFDRFATRTVTYRQYLVEGAAHVVPLFLGFALLQHAGLLLFGEHPQWSWLVTLSMTQGFFWDLRYRGLPAAWMLTIQESFRLLAPALFAALVALGIGPAGPRPGLQRREWSRLLWALAGAAVVLAAAGLGLSALLRARGWTPYGLLANPSHVLHATIAGRFPEFAIGVACAFAHRDAWPERVLRGVLATRAALGAVLGIFVMMALEDYAARTGWRALGLGTSVAIAALAGLLVLALTREDEPVARALAHPFGVYLGRISLGFYLIQASLLAAPFVGLAEKLGPARLVAEYVLLNLVCAAFHELLEQPARREILRRFSDRTRERAGA